MLVRKTKSQKLSRVQFAPDGRGLVAAGKFGAYWWPSVFDDAKPQQFGTEECNGVGFTPDGSHILAVVADGFRKHNVLAINLATRAQQSVPIEMTWISLSVCPTTGLAVTEPWNGGEMAGWRVGSDGVLTQVWKVDAKHGSIGSTVAFGPEGKWFVRGEQKPLPNRGYYLHLHDPATGAVIRSCEGGEWVSAGPAVSPDGEWIAFGFANRLCWQSTTKPKQRHHTVNDNTHQFTGVAYHPSGAFVAATNNDETVKLYEATTGELTRTFSWDAKKMRSVCFSPDGTLAAAGSENGKVFVWDVDP